MAPQPSFIDLDTTCTPHEQAIDYVQYTSHYVTSAASAPSTTAIAAKVARSLLPAHHHDFSKQTVKWVTAIVLIGIAFFLGIFLVLLIQCLIRRHKKGKK